MLRLQSHERQPKTANTVAVEKRPRCSFVAISEPEDAASVMFLVFLCFLGIGCDSVTGMQSLAHRAQGVGKNAAYSAVVVAVPDGEEPSVLVRGLFRLSVRAHCSRHRTMHSDSSKARCKHQSSVSKSVTYSAVAAAVPKALQQ